MYPDIKNNISKLHIKTSDYHGSQYEGNQCRQLLKSINRLNIPTQFKEFTEVLKSLRKLHSICNEDYLCVNYESHIDKFSKCWYKLADKYKISTTPKIHIILNHLCDYFDECEVTLKTVSDELVESMHQYVDKFMVRSCYKVKDVKNPTHGKNLFKAVCHVNSYNLRIKNV